MKKYIMCTLTLLLVILSMTFALLFSGCGYNRIMRDYLSVRDNYQKLVLEVEEVMSWNEDDSSSVYLVLLESAADINLDTLEYVRITCKVLSENDNSKITTKNDNQNANSSSIHFEIMKENTEYLLETDFFDIIKDGDILNVRSTLWTYMDTEFNYIAEIVLNDKTYLPFDKGLQNIVDHMNANKSLL